MFIFLLIPIKNRYKYSYTYKVKKRIMRGEGHDVVKMKYLSAQKLLHAITQIILHS